MRNIHEIFESYKTRLESYVLAKKGQQGFNLILPAVIVIAIAGFVLGILGKVNTDLGSGATTNSTLDSVTNNVGIAMTNFSQNFGTFFTLVLLAIILAIVLGFVAVRSRR